MKNLVRETMSSVLTMTPKLKLSDAERKVLLSWILKLCFPGMRWIIRSTHMIMAPATQARKFLT